MAVGAHGVHIGQEDMPYPLARRLLGEHAIIGLSVETIEQVREAEQYDLSYISVSPVFETPTKTDTKGAWGIEGLKQVRAITRHCVVAIGGINATNVQQVVRAGAEGIVVIATDHYAEATAHIVAQLQRQHPGCLRHRIRCRQATRGNCGSAETGIRCANCRL